MRWLDPIFSALLTFLLVAMAVFAGLAVRRATRRPTRRRIEAPNSHFDSPIIRENEALRRWRGLAPETVHEINRAEVERLIARAQAAGIASLSPAEIAFLDQVAVPPIEAPSRDRPNSVVSELRHRPT